MGKSNGAKFNLLSTIQSGLQLSQFDSAGARIKSNRLSLNLARLSLTATGFKDKMSLGIVTDFTSTTPILEGWVGFTFMQKRAKLILGI